MLNSYDMIAAGAELKKIRLQLDLSQSKVSKSAQISIDTIRRIENGMVVPRYDTLIILSSIYRCDTLKILNKYSTQKTLIDCYEDIDEAMISHDITDLKNKCKEFKLLLHSASVDGEIVYLDELKQILTFYEAMLAYYSDRQTHIILPLLTKALSIKYSDFNIHSYAKYPYSFIEMRLLLCYALCLSPTNLKLSTELLIFVYDSIADKTYEKEQLKVKLKVIYNISYNYYLLGQDESSEEFADLGITFARKHHILYSLPFLLARKGVARFYKKHDDYLKYIYQAISCSVIGDNKDLTHHLITDLQRTHDFKIDDQFLTLLELSENPTK